MKRTLEERLLAAVKRLADGYTTPDRIPILLLAAIHGSLNGHHDAQRLIGEQETATERDLRHTINDLFETAMASSPSPIAVSTQEARHARLD